jgi:hypothetical protein
MREFEMPYAQLALFIVKVLGVPGPYTLALDRTNWKIGAVNLNILMLSIVYRGIGIPVVWIVLSKSGASDTNERTTVMEIFLDLFGAQKVACLLGDREFVGREWFCFLKRYRIKFQMRLHRGLCCKNRRLLSMMADCPDPESCSEVCPWPKPIPSSGDTMNPRSSFSACAGICATPSVIAISKK